jgi:tRNA(fMet)-specific endonuclease VapC
MKSILLDTSGYSRFMAGDNALLQVLARADIVYMSVFVLGELYSGFRAGNREAWNKEILDRFLSKPTVRILDATHETSEIFGFIKNNLRKAGTPLPIKDVWIASHSMESGSTLITHDAHFKYIPGLLLWDY